MKPGSVAKGVGIGVLLTVGSIGLGFGLNAAHVFGLSMIILFGIGVVQALWIVPAYVVYRRRDEKETAKGLLIVAGLVSLLNASCWGLFMSGRIPLK